jgi:hypothetical protein
MLARSFDCVRNFKYYKNNFETAAAATESWTGSWRDNLHATRDSKVTR